MSLSLKQQLSICAKGPYIRRLVDVEGELLTHAAKGNFHFDLTLDESEVLTFGIAASRYFTEKGLHTYMLNVGGRHVLRISY